MTITSGVGLISGLPIADIVNQLIAIEARPRNFVENRNAILQAQQIALQSISVLNGDAGAAFGGAVLVEPVIFLGYLSVHHIRKRFEYYRTFFSTHFGIKNFDYQKRQTEIQEEVLELWKRRTRT